MSHPGPSSELFDPRTFFMAPWRGWGVAVNGFGAPVGRYETKGSGEVVDGRVRLSQHMVYDDGRAITQTWEIISDTGRTFEARELATGVVAQGRATRRGFRWWFHMPYPTPIGVRKARVEVHYSLTGKGEASGATAISLFGIRLLSLSTEFRHIARDSAAIRAAAEADAMPYVSSAA